MCSTCMNKSMYKNHQQWIALLVAVTFAWLLHVSATPLAAAKTTEQPSAEAIEPTNQLDSEQAPGFFEQAGDEWGRVRPKTSPLLLLAAIAALGFLYLLIHGIDIDAAPRDGMGASQANRGRMAIR